MAPNRPTPSPGDPGAVNGSYTGHVDAGGSPASREVMTPDGARVRITKVSVGAMDNNAYVLEDVDAGRGVLIDAAAEAERLLDVASGVEIATIVTTHRHADHWQALAEVAAATSATVMAGDADAHAIDHPMDGTLRDGYTVTVGAVILEVRHTPGHTPGSICLLLRADGDVGNHLFTGDTLFPGGPGNTFGDPAAFTRIMTTLRERIFDLPDDTWVYPGHGDDTTLARERPHLDEWEDRGW